MNELDKSSQKFFELRSYAVILAIKMRKTLLSFFWRLEDGVKMVAGRVDT